MAEKTPGCRFPGPPKVERDFSQWLERRRKSGNYIIDLKRRHGQRRNGKLAKN
jgi:hypothetical protein